MPDINSYTPQSGRVIGEDGKTYNLVDLLKGISGSGSGEVSVQNWPTNQNVTVQNQPKTVAVGNILGGTVDPNNAGDYPKLIAPDGANVIKIQCPKDNTVPLLVSNMNMDFGDFEVYPGTSETFYYNNLYVRLPEGTTEAQKIVFMAMSQQ